MLRLLAFLLLAIIVFIAGMNFGQKHSFPSPTSPSPSPSPSELSGEENLLKEAQEIFQKRVAQPLELNSKIRLALIKEAGVRAANLKIQLNQDTLTVSGELPYREQVKLVEKVLKKIPEIKKLEIKVSCPEKPFK